jgi:uncharacterized protein
MGARENFNLGAAFQRRREPAIIEPADAEGEVDMPARFMWYELMATDAAAAKAFYTAVVGWSAEEMQQESGAYTIFATNKGGVGGMVQLSPGEQGGGSVWVGYVGVDDVDAYAARLKAAGGAVHHGPADIPGIGRFAMVADPQGAAFTLFKGNQPEGPPTGEAGEPGYVGWHELMAADGAAAFDFYAGLFGWEKTSVVDMGPMGAYQLWTDGRGGDAGGMMTRPAGTPGPAWRYYVQVDAIDAAVTRTKAAGGAITNGPHQVPGGAWIVQGIDPQGAAFSLTSAVK